MIESRSLLHFDSISALLARLSSTLSSSTLKVTFNFLSVIFRLIACVSLLNFSTFIFMSACGYMSSIDIKKSMSVLHCIIWSINALSLRKIIICNLMPNTANRLEIMVNENIVYSCIYNYNFKHARFNFLAQKIRLYTYILSITNLATCLFWKHKWVQFELHLDIHRGCLLEEHIGDPATCYIDYICVVSAVLALVQTKSFIDNCAIATKPTDG